MRLPSSLVITLLAIVAIPSAALAQYKMQTPSGEAPGPWLFGTIGVGKGADGKPLTTALKGLAIKLGENGEAGIAYDLDLCRVAGVWTGGKFVTPMNLMSRGEYPTSMGDVMFTTDDVPGFEVKEPEFEPRERSHAWKDPRQEPIGPLPLGQVRFKAYHRNGAENVIKWSIDGINIREQPEFVTSNGIGFLKRTFGIEPHKSSILIPLCPATKYSGIHFFSTQAFDARFSKLSGVIWEDSTSNSATALLIDGAGLEIESGGQRCVLIHPSESIASLSVYFWRGPLADAERIKNATKPDTFRSQLSSHPSGAFLPWITAIRTPRWPEAVITSAAAASTQSAVTYVVDTVKLPDPNPWAAPMFIGGFDFFPDGRAAICTFHGDVFIVSGLEGDLKRVTWRRFASGLYHPLGLKIVKGEIYVICRDGLWRLRNLNSQADCDLYEAFNFDLKVTKSFHEFVFDLQRDNAGNFYFAKAGPVKNGGRGFDEIMSQHGTVMRVSPDGSKLDVVATGFRAPNGIGVGPNGELTSGDNEGTWTPTCKINWIKPGGFYGVVDLAHRKPAPTSYDPPLCWLPKRIDNSGGSQVWVPEDDRWGPWRGKMLHLSYGHAALYGVMREEVGGITQGGVTRFPLKFESGIMRARFHPKDGQLWVAGLRGWQTDGIRNGCLQRVRYTGAPVQMPIELHAKKSGIELRFTSSIDTQSAIDPENWNVEVWNYLWSAAYGSPEISTITEAEKPADGSGNVAQFTQAQMTKAQHDPLTIKSVTVGTDDRSVFLEIEGMKPVMQMSIRYGFKSADGSDLKGEVVNTIHALGE
jgi:Domain of unknown function (DUF6797)